MTAPAFTPAPWSICTSVRILPDLHYREIMGRDDEGCSIVIGEVYSDVEGGQPTDERAEANATLIAAAPDLYEALSKAVRELETRLRAGLAEAGYSAEEIAGIVDACPAIIDGRAALNKALGQ